MPNEPISLHEAERVTALPSAVIKGLVECGELRAQSRDGELFVDRSALLAWCRLFAKVLTVVARRNPGNRIGSALTARNLTWLAQAGLLNGKERVRL